MGRTRRRAHKECTTTWRGQRTAPRERFAYFPTPILPKIVGEPTREALIDLHRIISGNAASAASNLRGGRHGHLALMMTAEDYLA